MTTCEIPLSQGNTAIVDRIDYQRITKFKWHCRARKGFTTYAGRNSTNPITGKRETILMHNQIMGTKSIDHIDGNGLNNTRVNLRASTPAQNARNRGKQKTNTSGYKGVCYDKSTGKWTAQIQVNYKKINLGSFTDALVAHKHYVEACIKYHGEFAKTL